MKYHLLALTHLSLGISQITLGIWNSGSSQWRTYGGGVRVQTPPEPKKN